MAGIGFELNKIFQRKSVISCISAYMAAAVVFTGPMLMGAAMLFIVRVLSALGGALRYEQDVIVVIITYALISSLVVSNIFAATVSRYTADALYNEKFDRVMPSLLGCAVVQLVAGGALYGVFIAFSGAGPLHGALGLILFCELTVVWNLINYMSTVKDYVRIIAIFALGAAANVISALALIYLPVADIVASMLLSVYIGYGVIILGYYRILKRYFPESDGKHFRFLEQFFLNPELAAIGLCVSVGLFAHFVFVWLSPYGVHIFGLFYNAPLYDIPALFAFVSVLITTIAFSTATEVNFYPAYKRYFDLLNADGSLQTIELAEREMLSIMKREYIYLALKQFVATILVITVGSAIMGEAGLAGFNSTTSGIFRVLCVGYGIYASAYSILLFLLYFTNYRGALISAALFAAGTFFAMFYIVGTAKFAFYGFGVAGGAIPMYASAAFSLWRYTGKIRYRVFSRQPLYSDEKHGFLYNMLKGLWKDEKPA